MRTPLIASILIAALATGQPAGAAPVSVTREDQREVMVTIYNGNLGLVKDVREARLARRVTAEVQFMDVAAQIDPTTVHLKSLDRSGGAPHPRAELRVRPPVEPEAHGEVRRPQGPALRERRHVPRGDPPVDATARSFEINGQIHLGHYGRVVLPALPDNLVSKPTLVWLLRSQAARPQRVEASYLTGGHHLEGRLRRWCVNAADTKADLTGWVTIDNKSGATYANATLKLVAGDVNRAQDAPARSRVMEVAAKAASPAPRRRDFAAEGFFEYHLYTLDGRTTIKDNQTKQLALLAASGRAGRRRSSSTTARQDYYRTQLRRCRCRTRRSAVYLELKNSKENRLGLPLPKGKVRVYKADAVGQPAVHRRGLDRPHPQGRDA